jgi:Spy/CpxP family protein refolding chaperone
MKMYRTMVLAFGVAALMAAPTWAQQQKGRGGGRFGGGFGGGAVLLSNKSVQKELKVTDEQAEKLNTFAREAMEKQREQFQGLGDLSQDERREKMQELAKTRAAELRKGMDEILKPEQIKRFEEIQLQQAGASAFLTPRVQEGLKLTDEQKTRLREISEEANQAMRDAFQGAQTDREGARKKFADTRRQANEKAMGVLTDEQKKAWKEMTGEPFEITFEPRPRN